MKIFAISDLHLSFETDKPLTDEVGHMFGAGAARTKPMNLFGGHWDNYEERIRADWNARVGADDIGIIAGDISWAMRMEETGKDFEYLRSLNGKKIIIRGNHDYWWKSISKIRETIAPNGYALQNDAVIITGADGVSVCFAGTRGWRVPERRFVQTDEDKKIYNREIIRFELALKDAHAKMANIDATNNNTDAPKIPLIAVLHYPPFNAVIDPSPFTELCEKYGVTACVYGHLHGKNGGRANLYAEKNGVKYYLTSCDLLNHKLVQIDV